MIEEEHVRARRDGLDVGRPRRVARSRSSTRRVGVSGSDVVEDVVAIAEIDSAVGRTAMRVATATKRTMTAAALTSGRADTECVRTPRS